MNLQKQIMQSVDVTKKKLEPKEVKFSGTISVISTPTHIQSIIRDDIIDGYDNNNDKKGSGI